MQFLRRFLVPSSQVFCFGLKLLHFVGLWGDRMQIFKYCLLVTWMIVVLIAPKAILGSGKQGFNSFARSLAELIFLVEVCISIGIFASRRVHFEQLFKVLESFLRRKWSLKAREEIDSFIMRMDKFSRLYSVYIVFLVILFAGVPIVSTILKVLLCENDKRSDFILVVELQFYGLNIRRDIVHYFIYMVFCITGCMCSAYQSTIKVAVVVVLIPYGSKLFELVSTRITGMVEIDKVEDRRDELREIVELHNLAFQYVTHLEATICFMLINQILNCILIWCLMMFYISTNFGPNAANVMLLFLVLMGEMVVYCVNGAILSEKAAGVADALYNYPWYTESIEMQKNMLLIIQRAQRPTGITAAKFYFVNLEILGMVIQTSYSYFLILKQMF